MGKDLKILVVDDELEARELVRDILADDYTIELAQDGIEALEMMKKDTFGVVILDLQMPRMGGMETLKRIKKDYKDTVVIVLTAYGTIETAVEAMKLGAYDYLQKPSKIDEIIIKVKKAIETLNLTKENIYLKKEREQEYGLPNIIGQSKALQEVIKLVKKVAKTNANVLIYGESGTGKELVAKAIHINSLRADKPFIIVNCAAIPETLLESELFGYAPKSGISGADPKGKPGKFELADLGSIFLDEIGDMSLSTQAKILRVLQEKEFERISGTKPIKVDVRIIAATNKNLETAIKEKTFREDLYFRLNVISISLPPLRERKEDIPLLIQHFIDKYAKETKKNVTKISNEALELLMNYDYPGNVRELENLVERAVILTEGDTIPLSALPTNLSSRRMPATATKSKILDSEALPSLSEVLSIYNAPSYIKIPNPDVQKKVFLKTFIQQKGILEDVKDKLGISHGAVHEHFRLVREIIFVSLCRYYGNIENLAKSWHVSAQDLQVAISKKNRLLKFVEGILRDYNQDEEKAAKRFNVTLDEFKEAFRRLKELST